MTLRQSRYVISRFIMIAALLLGCGVEEPAGVQVTLPSPQKPPALMTVQSPPQEQQEVKVSLTYDPAGRRDPFYPIIGVGEKKGDTGKRTTPLQRVHISDLKLVGILWGSFGFRALVQTPDGRSHPLVIGTLVGRNRGVVKKIFSDRVIIEESYRDQVGEVKEREVVLLLHPKKEET